MEEPKSASTEEGQDFTKRKQIRMETIEENDDVGDGDGDGASDCDWSLANYDDWSLAKNEVGVGEAASRWIVKSSWILNLWA